MVISNKATNVQIKPFHNGYMVCSAADEVEFDDFIEAVNYYGGLVRIKGGEFPVWLDPYDNPPHWGDNNKAVEILRASGEIVRGVVDQYDSTSGPDEHPVARMLLQNGDRVEWFSDGWVFRFIEASQ